MTPDARRRRGQKRLPRITRSLNPRMTIPTHRAPIEMRPMPKNQRRRRPRHRRRPGLREMRLAHIGGQPRRPIPRMAHRTPGRRIFALRRIMTPKTHRLRGQQPIPHPHRRSHPRMTRHARHHAMLRVRKPQWHLGAALHRARQPHHPQQDHHRSSTTSRAIARNRKSSARCACPSSVPSSRIRGVACHSPASTAHPAQPS
jgi:hypothetical protein